MAEAISGSLGKSWCFYVTKSLFFYAAGMSNYSIWEANQQNFSWETLEKTQAIGGGGGGGGVMRQNEESQNLGNPQCDLGQIAYFFSLGSLISKMEARKSNLLHKVVVSILSTQSAHLF